MKLILKAKTVEVDDQGMVIEEVKRIDLLKKLMKLDGYSQAEAGKLLGVTAVQISRYLSGKANIPSGVLIKIKKALGEDE